LLGVGRIGTQWPPAAPGGHLRHEPVAEALPLTSDIFTSRLVESRAECLDLRRLRPMRMRGLEPPPGFPDTDLNRARLPIPPHPRGHGEHIARRAPEPHAGSTDSTPP
jgi:hypothetical protein